MWRAVERCGGEGKQAAILRYYLPALHHFDCVCNINPNKHHQALRQNTSNTCGSQIIRSVGAVRSILGDFHTPHNLGRYLNNWYAMFASAKKRYNIWLIRLKECHSMTQPKNVGTRAIMCAGITRIGRIACNRLPPLVHKA
jgi:nucleosome binding factor SPN SPT16 subunit